MSGRHTMRTLLGLVSAKGKTVGVVAPMRRSVNTPADTDIRADPAKRLRQHERADGNPDARAAQDQPDRIVGEKRLNDDS
jgi:hypothetical protein